MTKDPIESIYPLAPLQQGLLFHTLADRNAYFNQTVYALEGNLNAAAFKQAWQRVIDRHAIFRTLFLWERRSEPLQVVRRQVELPCEEHDWRSLSPAAREERLEIFLAADRSRGLDLSAAPLMRLALARTGEAAFYFIWTTHHLLLDRWSTSIVLREVSLLYQSLAQNRDAGMNPSRPYRDYIAWLRRQDLSQAEEFWRRTLKGYTAPAPLKLERPAGAAAGHGTARLRLSESATAALESLGRRHRVTLNTLVQGAWAILLSRYSGAEDVVFGATVSGRPAELAGVESMVGLFINTLPVRVAAAPSEPLLPWLQKLQDRMVELRQYEYSPLIRVQEWSEVPRGTPLFESILVFENIPLEHFSGEANGGGIKTIRVRIDDRATHYALTLMALPGPELRLVLTYDAGRFSAPAAARLMENLRTLLESFAAHPERRLSELSMLSEAERRLHVEWNDTDREYPRDLSVHELFEQQAERSPHAVAVDFPAADSQRSSGRLTYGELNRRADRLAGRLLEAGAEPETRVGVYLERSAEMIVAFLAILKAGCAYVPIDLDAPKERVAFMLADSRAKFLLTEKQLARRLPEWRGENIYLEPDGKSLAGAPARNPARRASGASLAYVIYTSGSTGNPKGVAVPHRAINRLVVNCDYAPLGPRDVVAQAANASFDAATFEIWGALLNGARLAGIPTGVLLSPQKFAAAIEKQKISALFLTTALFNLMAQETPGAFKNVRHLLFGGEAVDPKWVAEVLRHGPPERLLHVYGPTETTTFASWHRVEAVAEDAATVPIGRPIANTRIYLLDRFLAPAPLGAAGEIHIGGDGLARGYLDLPELTAEKFIGDPFAADPAARLYKTGDLARRLPDGTIEFIGRLDDQVKIRGFRIEPGEIESALAQNPAVAQAAVAARDDAGQKKLVAYVVAAREPAPAETELKEFLKKKLPGYMIPSAFVFLESFPLTSNGKIDRRALPEPGRLAPDRIGYAAPTGVIEQELARIWEELLGTGPIGVDDDFFDRGGHSLLAIQMAHRIEQTCGQRLPLTALLAGPTIRQLAEALRKHRVEENRSLLVRVQPAGNKTPIFFLHGDFRRGGFYCLILARCLGADRPFYALAPHGLNGSAVPETVEAMAASYIEMVREVQPRGPYLLGGFCNGGTVALEMARVLRERGEEITLVMLVAAPARNALGKRFARRFSDALGALLGIGPEKSLRLFLGLRACVKPVQRIVRRARGIYRKRRSPTGDLFLRALSTYIPKPYPGAVAHFWPSESGAAADALRNWSQAIPRMEMQSIPGNHVTCVSVHAQALGDRMKTCLEAARV